SRVRDVYQTGRSIARLGELTLGIVGFGRIGSAVSRRARAFEMRILAHDPVVDTDTIRQGGVEPVSFDDLLRESDIVSIHAPLTAQTHHLFGDRELRLMRRGAVLVNTA